MIKIKRLTSVKGVLKFEVEIDNAQDFNTLSCLVNTAPAHLAAAIGCNVTHNEVSEITYPIHELTIYTRKFN